MKRSVFRVAAIAALGAVSAMSALLGCRAAHADLIKQSAAYTRTVLMTSSSDHITGATGLTLSITLSKAGGAFASISPTVTELGSGWYAIALVSGNTGTLGALDLHITATGADPTDSHDQVVGFDPGDASLLGLTGVGTAAAQTALSTKIGTPAGASIAADIAANLTAVNGVPAAVQSATVLSSASNSGTSTPALTAQQRDALLLAVSVGNYDATAPVASGTATFKYYLVGRPHTSPYLVETATVSYDAAKVPTSRNVVVASPFPTVP